MQSFSDVDLLPAEDDEVAVTQHRALRHQLVVDVDQQVHSVAVAALTGLDAAARREHVAGGGAARKVLDLAACGALPRGPVMINEYKMMTRADTMLHI